MKFFNIFRIQVPRPFKSLQKFLNIENEWSTLKVRVKYHKFKLISLGLILSYPYYSPIFSVIKMYFRDTLDKSLQQDKPIPNIISSFIKSVLDDIFKDRHVRREGSIFLEDVFK